MKYLLRYGGAEMTHKLLFLLCGLYYALIVMAPANGQALSPMQPAASVNDRVITVYDVLQRVDLILIESGTPRNALNRKLIASRVLDELINEQLRLIEAESRDLLPTEFDITQAIKNFEAQNNWPTGSAPSRLKAQNIDFEAFKNIYRAALAWNNIVTQMLAPSIEVTEAEIARETKRLRNFLAQNNAQEVRLLLILLAGDANNPALQQDAQRLLRSLQQGGEFSTLARQFSDDMSSQYGGDLGWVTSDIFKSEELSTWLENAHIGAISSPYGIAEGIAILKIQDRRQASEADILIEEVRQNIGNTKLQSMIRVLETSMHQRAIIKRFINL